MKTRPIGNGQVVVHHEIYSWQSYQEARALEKTRLFKGHPRRILDIQERHIPS